MKHPTILFLAFLLTFSSCEQLRFTELEQPTILKSNVSYSLEVPSFYIEPVICDIKECDLDNETTNKLAKCIQCLSELVNKEVQITYYFFSIRQKGCEDPLFACHPPMPLEEFVIAIDYEERKNISGQITTENGEIYAETTEETISYKEGKAFLHFQPVNRELSREFLKLTISTNTQDRSGILPIIMTGNLGEGGFTE